MMTDRMKLAGGVLMLCSLLALSCSKNGADLPGKKLGTIVVDAAPGTFPVSISTDVNWRAVSADSWLSVESGWMLPEDVCRVAYTSNESVLGDIRLSRAGRIFFETADGIQRDTLVVLQRGATPFLSMPSSKNVSEEGDEYSLELASNLPDAARPRLHLGSTASWIFDVRLNADATCVLFTVAEGSDRSADVAVSYTDVFGETVTASCTINQ